ncbi:ogr/Delta-like zinc finger family protein [Rappaport israeli]|uniref:ogr/Delta-like zinc finger family protein n=1 Tax=Rappaport israeli TaxID=1839807 RepID=UPI000931D5EC|nr:ogr/Delta-like zinc finger family protein [Rappaport israeli]
MKIKRLPCPACGAPTRIHGSRAQHQRLRRAYAQCTNYMCSASWLLQIEVTRVASPSSDLFKTTIRPSVPQSDPYDLAKDMAQEFVSRGNPKWTRDETLAQCVQYLLTHIDLISRSSAEMISAQAIANYESRFINQWHINIDNSTSNVLIVNRHPTPNEQLNGRGHEQRVISLRELVEFINARDQQDEQGDLI